MSIRRYLPGLLIGLIAAASTGGALAQGNGPNAPAALAGTGFTYEGELRNVAGLVTATCDFQFSLYDADLLGTQVGAAQTATGVGVVAGRFSVTLNGGGEFGGRAFDGSARWLSVAVNCPPDSGFAQLIPRQPLTAAPLALALPGLRTELNPTSPNVIGGSISNTVSAGIVGASIGGGGSGSVPNNVGGNYGTVAGGLANSAGGPVTTVSGGRGNTASGDDASVAGGLDNTASGAGATVGGGGWDGANQAGNLAAGAASTIGGGLSNVISPTAGYATVSGGRSNTVSGQYATVAGGQNNSATATGAFAAGQNANADEVGSFVWDDGTAAVAAVGPHSFNAVATGGFFFYAGQGDCSLTDATGWICLSDRNLKENFTSLDTRAMLAALSRMPVTEWNVKGSPVKHIGPVAQDFYAAFNIGADNQHINTVDEQGVALAAIQGLYGLVMDQDARIAALQQQNAGQQQVNADLQSRVAALEHKLNGDSTAPQSSGVPISWIVVAAAAVGAFWIGRRGWAAQHDRNRSCE